MARILQLRHQTKTAGDSVMHQPCLPRRQSGFTLIEIAIVLVIIGLLLGGILKGQELINSARVKNLATDFRNIPLFIYAYQDKYRALPGDDAAVVAHLGSSATSATAGTTLGNGAIDGAWDAVSPSTADAFLFWQHVRLAGLAPGPTVTTAADYPPTNSVGGRIGIQSAAPFTGMNGTYFICSAAIQGKYVKQLDTQLDDGNTATGSMMAGTTLPTAIATTSIVDATPYTVCMGI
jgi:prepilin-type N-terminal cleavage/methylation domain-containing protein